MHLSSAALLLLLLPAARAAAIPNQGDLLGTADALINGGQLANAIPNPAIDGKDRLAPTRRDEAVNRLGPVTDATAKLEETVSVASNAAGGLVTEKRDADKATRDTIDSTAKTAAGVVGEVASASVEGTAEDKEAKIDSARVYHLDEHTGEVRELSPEEIKKLVNSLTPGAATARRAIGDGLDSPLAAVLRPVEGVDSSAIFFIVGGEARQLSPEEIKELFNSLTPGAATARRAIGDGADSPLAAVLHPVEGVESSAIFFIGDTVETGTNEAGGMTGRGLKETAEDKEAKIDSVAASYVDKHTRERQLIPDIAGGGPDAEVEGLFGVILPLGPEDVRV